MFGDQRRGRVAKDILAVRALRENSFPSELFDEHAWNMLLNLFSALVDNKTVSEILLFQLAGTTSSAGNRWLRHLIVDGQVEARNDGGDVALTSSAIGRMRLFLDAADAVHSGTVALS